MACRFFRIRDLAYFKVFTWDEKGYELSFGQLSTGKGSKNKTPIKFQLLFMITKKQLNNEKKTSTGKCIK